MPGLYKEGEYDLSGCAVGIVKKDSLINGKNIVAGDVLIGLPSTGVHSNGFSLVRRFVLNMNLLITAILLGMVILFVSLLGYSNYFYRVLAQSGLSFNDQLPGGDVTVAEALMAPTVIYVKQVIHHFFVSKNKT